MTTTSLNAVGFCAHYSRQGDWAFRYALHLARRQDLQLNIFHFLRDPYGKEEFTADRLSAEDRERLAIGREKELRLYYDDRLGSYLKAGFRLCEDNGWTELHRCLCNREFQVLVLAYPEYEAQFVGKPLTRFAHSFVCPVVLVGPDHPDQFTLNNPAVLLSETLHLGNAKWSRLEPAGAVPVPGASGVAEECRGGYTRP